MNVFITGGTGCLGRAVVPTLLRRGHEVRVLVRSVEQPHEGMRVVDVPQIRAARL